jgi:hypothetical protein
MHMPGRHADLLRYLNAAVAASQQKHDPSPARHAGRRRGFALQRQ